MIKKSQIAVLALNCLFAVMATSCVADEINWQRVQPAVNRSYQVAHQLHEVATFFPPQYSSIRSQMLQELVHLKMHVETVAQNVQILRQNPDNSLALNTAIQNAREASQSAERIESLARDLNRAADDADDDQMEKLARGFKRMADVIDDEMSRVRRELD